MTDNTAAQKRVLIVEDEPDFAALLQSILAGAGYTVATAYNCEDALSQVRAATPDLITLDIQMSRKSGAFFYRKLKSEKKFRDIPVVVVTGIMYDKEMENIIRSLMETDAVPHPQAYLEKPIEGPELLKAVEEAMAAGKAARC